MLRLNCEMACFDDVGGASDARPGIDPGGVTRACQGDQFLRSCLPSKGIIDPTHHFSSAEI